MPEKDDDDEGDNESEEEEDSNDDYNTALTKVNIKESGVGPFN